MVSSLLGTSTIKGPVTYTKIKKKWLLVIQCSQAIYKTAFKLPKQPTLVQAVWETANLSVGHFRNSKLVDQRYFSEGFSIRNFLECIQISLLCELLLLPRNKSIQINFLISLTNGNFHCLNFHYSLYEIQDSNVQYQKNVASLTFSAQEPDAGSENIICIWNQ